MRLSAAFYRHDDVVSIARELLGKYLVTNVEGQASAGRIVETEAYRGPDDKACHAYSNRRTRRTAVMFENGGRAYVYLCYGIHHLFNVVTGTTGKPHAVLIRGLEPTDNTPLMMKRRGFDRLRPQLTAGPGVLSQALGIKTVHTGCSLIAPGSPIWIEDRGELIAADAIGAGPRIGVDYAGECATWPWRFYLKESKWVSKRTRR
jgi:DNA-3-methyladenine glycosylase